MCRLMAVANSKAPASGKPTPPKQLLPFIAHMAKTEGLGAFYQVELLGLLDRPMSSTADCWCTAFFVTTEYIILAQLAQVEPAQSPPQNLCRGDVVWQRMSWLSLTTA